ncbi:predicted protein [Brucella sp. F5/99]|nr:predicted protein [Brucella sp. F5/99]
MGMFVRTIGIARAAMKIGMVNLAYNISRYVWHEKKAAISFVVAPIRDHAFFLQAVFQGEIGKHLVPGAAP